MENDYLFVSYKQLVSSLLTCPCCYQQYTDPVYLPCQHLVCRECIPRLREATEDDQTNARLTCPQCGLTHHKKKLEEYETSLIAEKLLGLQPVRVARGTQFEEIIEKTRADATSLIEILEGTHTLISQAETKIFDHFSMIKAQIDLSTEKKIQKLQKARDEILKELNFYQEECTDHLNGLSRLIITQFSDYAEQCQDTLEIANKPDCVEADVISSHEQILEMKKFVDEWKEELEPLKLFCGPVVYFKENKQPIHKQSIGALTFDTPRQLTLPGFNNTLTSEDLNPDFSDMEIAEHTFDGNISCFSSEESLWLD